MDFILKKYSKIIIFITEELDSQSRWSRSRYKPYHPSQIGQLPDRNCPNHSRNCYNCCVMNVLFQLQMKIYHLTTITSVVSATSFTKCIIVTAETARIKPTCNIAWYIHIRTTFVSMTYNSMWIKFTFPEGQLWRVSSIWTTTLLAYPLGPLPVHTKLL